MINEYLDEVFALAAVAKVGDEDNDGSLLTAVLVLKKDKVDGGSDFVDPKYFAAESKSKPVFCLVETEDNNVE